MELVDPLVDQHKTETMVVLLVDPMVVPLVLVDKLAGQ
jgi:hypothetical protein